jgi:Spy/CpxP family protein refolding chaperone
MKKLLALSLVFAAFSLSVSAQETSKPAQSKVAHEHKHGKHGKEMMKGVNLSDAQKSQIRSIREDKTLSKEARKEKMSGVFTADQKSAIAKNKTAMKTQRKEMHEKRSKEMKEKLGLSEDQSAKLKTQHEATRNQMKALKADQSLSNDQKKEKMKTIKENAKAQRNTVLTADQQKKMDDMRKEGKAKFKKAS